MKCGSALRMDRVVAQEVPMTMMGMGWLEDRPDSAREDLEVDLIAAPHRVRVAHAVPAVPGFDQVEVRLEAGRDSDRLVSPVR